MKNLSAMNGLAKLALIFGLSFLVTTTALSGEWNEKPIVCHPLVEIQGILKQNEEVLLANGIQATPVRDKAGISDVPAFIPISIYVNPKTQTYTIIEYHPSYDTYCVLSVGAGWEINGETL